MLRTGSSEAASFFLQVLRDPPAKASSHTGVDISGAHLDALSTSYAHLVFPSSHGTKLHDPKQLAH